jgi:phosphate:Na+ symporter
MFELFFRIISIIGALGLFIYGMKVMSEGIQHAAGAQMRKYLRALTGNRFLGLTNGFLLTGFVQSSSAVTVLTVGLVNAGLLTLMESIPFIMGANIGTTVTGWLVAVIGFKVKLHLLALPMMAIALPMLFRSRGKLKFWGQTIIGLALLFMGLEFLQDYFPDLSSQPDVLAFLRKISTLGFFAVLLYVLAGTILTGIVQSSSAMMAVILVMSANGWLSFTNGAALLLGANIGTTVTANLAATVGNTFAKRAALFHSLFNVIGVLWMIPLLGFFLQLIDWICIQLFTSDSAFTNIDFVPIALSAFHTAFNLVNALFLIFFIPPLMRLLTWILPGKDDSNTVFKLAFLNYSVSTPELNLFEVQRAVSQFGEKVNSMLPLTRSMLHSTDRSTQMDLLQRVHEIETTTDRMEREITSFLGVMATTELSNDVAIRISRFQSICRELERIADVFYSMSKQLEQKNLDQIWFSPDQRDRLLKLLALVESSMVIMQKNLNAREGSEIQLEAALVVEDQINQYRNHIRSEHIEDIQNEEYHIPAGLIYNNLIANLERIGDHTLNVSEALMDAHT